MATTGLVRSVNQRVCKRLGATITSSKRNVAVRAAAKNSVVEKRNGHAQLPWEDLSLNAVYVNEKEGDSESPSTSGHTFGCDLQEKLFHVNVGKAITTLREELPQVLEKDLSYDIYTEDVAFLDEISPKLRRKAKTAVGKEQYKRVAWSIRFHTWLFFYRASFDVTNIWQPAEDVIAVRWSFRGLPRIIGNAFPGSTSYVDGISEFKLNRQGLIYEHKVDNLDFSNSQVFKLQDLTSLLNTNQSWPTPSYFSNE